MQQTAPLVGGNWFKTGCKESIENLSEDKVRMMKSKVIMDIWRITIQPQNVMALILSEEIFDEYIREFDWLMSNYNNENLLYIDNRTDICRTGISMYKLSIVDADKDQQLFLTKDRIGIPMKDFLLWYKGVDAPNPKLLEEWSGIPKNRLRWVYDKIVSMLEYSLKNS